MINISKISSIYGTVTVQIEGFFTERFINLCKINNIKIYDIRNITNGIVRFKINMDEFKKLRKIAKKTKCKVSIKDKKGLYFKLFKYRKRKMILLLVLIAVTLCLIFSSFIWKVEIVGNETLQSNVLKESLKQSGMYVGKCKFNIDKKDIINKLRINQNDITWAGIEIEGSKVIVTIVEKTRVDNDSVQNSSIGNIVATKSGIISKIVAENGTPLFKEGSYIYENDVAIEGAIYNKYVDNKKVVAKGILEADCEYTIIEEYNYEYENRIYNGKKKYRISINTKVDENVPNSLNNNKKYDITKSVKRINIFGKTIYFNLFTCKEYIAQKDVYSKEQLVDIANKNIDCKVKENMDNNCVDAKLVSKDTKVEETETGIKCYTTYVLNENIAKFIVSDESSPYLLKNKTQE